MNANVIEARGYVATDADVEAITRTHLSAVLMVGSSKVTYLRALVATAQAELGLEPRAKPGKAKTLDKTAVVAQVAAARKVHERFLEIVTRVASENLPASDKAKELNRRTNFARTAAYALMRPLRRGLDLSSIAAARVTKAALLAMAPPMEARPPSPARSRKRAHRLVERLTSELRTLADVDMPAAVSELEAIMSFASGRLAELGVTTVTKTQLIKTPSRRQRGASHVAGLSA